MAQQKRSEIENVVPAFAFDGALVSVKELRSGHINQTYCLTMDTGRNYLLQQVNGYVFKDPQSVMRNIRRVTTHLRASLIADGLDPERRVLTLIPTRDGAYYTLDGSGNLWRAYHFIHGATAHNAAKDAAQLRVVGYAFGEFQKRLGDFPADELAETIPHFHDTPQRVKTFIQAVEEDRAGRVAAARREIDQLLERSHRAGEIVDRLARGELPTRVTHNDTKINNVMIDDQTGEALCVIDLDTVMPGSMLYDFGDAIRFGAASAPEDERDLDKMYLDMDKYRFFTEGFLKATGDALTPLELELMPVAPWMLTYELTLRFLGDYLDGDRYFRTDFPEHNLIRARAQAALLFDTEKRLTGAVNKI